MSCKHDGVRLAVVSKLCFYGGGAGRKNNSLLFALFLQFFHYSWSSAIIYRSNELTIKSQQLNLTIFSSCSWNRSRAKLKLCSALDSVTQRFWLTEAPLSYSWTIWNTWLLPHPCDGQRTLHKNFHWEWSVLLWKRHVIPLTRTTHMASPNCRSPGKYKSIWNNWWCVFATLYSRPIFVGQEKF